MQPGDHVLSICTLVQLNLNIVANPREVASFKPPPPQYFDIEATSIMQPQLFGPVVTGL